MEFICMYMHCYIAVHQGIDDETERLTDTVAIEEDGTLIWERHLLQKCGYCG